MPKTRLVRGKLTKMVGLVLALWRPTIRQKGVEEGTLGIPELSRRVKSALCVKSYSPERPTGVPDGPASVTRLFPIASNFSPKICDRVGPIAKFAKFARPTPL